ncbi:MAG TPA: 16S rRNA (guanine(527)-N(7))-methyltransferase RsmG [Actinomycetota bacterium]|nr:16S rRNA (guanine(527)-N(7))-methyltransferase RsmG [Actinomycetota bacterium]
MDRAGILVRQAEELGIVIDDARAEQLLAFERLLLERAIPLGAVAAGDAPRLRERHVLDSLRAARALSTGDRIAVDLGTGAGLPGLVLAIARPDVRFTLLEPRQRRAAFVELAVERLGLRNVRVLARRAEELSALVGRGVEPPADLALARALGSLERCLRLARGLLGPGGRLVWFAGKMRVGPLPPAAEVIETPELESAGPLVIMGGQ